MWTEMDVYDNAFYICWCNLLSTEREQNTVGKKEEGRGGRSERAKTFFPTLYFPRYLSHSCSVRSSLPFPLPLPTLTFFLPSLSSHSLPFSFFPTWFFSPPAWFYTPQRLNSLAQEPLYYSCWIVYSWITRIKTSNVFRLGLRTNWTAPCMLWRRCSSR